MALWRKKTGKFDVIHILYQIQGQEDSIYFKYLIFKYLTTFMETIKTLGNKENPKSITIARKDCIYDSIFR